MKGLLFFSSLLIVLLVAAFALSKEREGFVNPGSNESLLAPQVVVPTVNPKPSVLEGTTPDPYLPPAEKAYGPAFGEIARVNTLPYKDPSLEAAPYARLAELQESLKAFFAFEAKSLQKMSDPEIQLPLTTARGDLSRITDEVMVLKRNPGIGSALTQGQVDDIQANLNYLQRKYRLSVNSASGGSELLEGFTTDSSASQSNDSFSTKEVIDTLNKMILELLPSGTTLEALDKKIRFENLNEIKQNLNNNIEDISKSRPGVGKYSKENIGNLLPELTKYKTTGMTDEEKFKPMSVEDLRTVVIDVEKLQNDIKSSGMISDNIVKIIEANDTLKKLIFINESVKINLKLNGPTASIPGATIKNELPELYERLTKNKTTSPTPSTTPTPAPGARPIPTTPEEGLAYFHALQAEINKQQAHNNSSQSGNMTVRRRNTTNGNKLSVQDLKDLKVAIFAEITRLSASGTTDPVMTARVNTLTNIKNNVDTILNEIETGIREESQIPITKDDLKKFLPAMSDPSKPLPKLLNENNLPPSAANIFPAYSSGDATGAKIAQNLFDKYGEAVMNGLSWGIELKYTSPREAQARGGQPARPIDSVSGYNMASPGNLKMTGGLYENGNMRYPMSLEPQGTASAVPGPARGEFESLTTPIRGVNTHFVNGRPVADVSEPAKYDWKAKSAAICESIRKRGLNPADFGCIDPSTRVGPDYSWRGNARMVCTRLMTTLDPGLPETCGCPPMNWRGWRS